MRLTGIIVPAALTVLTGVALAQAPGLDGTVAPIDGIKIPPGYRKWTLISVALVGTPSRKGARCRVVGRWITFDGR